MMRKVLAMAASVALLAACDSSGDAPAGEGAAEGEVLGGTISDDMLPLDTVTSQSPPLREASEAGEGDAAAAEPAAADDAAPAEAPDEGAEEPTEEEPAAPAPDESEDDGE